MKYLITVFLLSFIIIAFPVQAQEFEDYVSKYTSENGQDYLQPLADAFGANLNSGLYHTAKISKFGLNVYIGVESMMALVADEQRTFMATTEEPFSPQQTVESPTVFGPTEGPSVEGTGGTKFNFPGGMDVKRLPLAVPQMTVGSFLGTQGTLRYIDMELGDNIGKVQLFGFGVRHSISQYFVLFPIDLAASFYRQSFEVGDIVDASATAFGIQASKSFSLLTLYGGLGIENANLDITYNFGSETDPQEISFNLDANNSVRFTAGVALQLALLNIHADYNMASQNTLALGVGVEL